MSLTFQWSPVVTGVSNALFELELLGTRNFFRDELGGCMGVVVSASSISAGISDFEILPWLGKGVNRICEFWRLGAGVLSIKGRLGNTVVALVEAGASLRMTPWSSLVSHHSSLDIRYILSFSFLKGVLLFVLFSPGYVVIAPFNRTFS